MSGCVRRIALVLAVWAALAAGVGRAELFVVPSDLAAVEGNLNNGFPFNITPFSQPSQRYQQVYAASQFNTGGLPILINQIIFRPDAETGGVFASTLANIQINLSMTPRGPDGLSMTFADNIGLNELIVYSGSLSLSSAFTGPPNGPKNFDIVINLQTPFLFDPTAGNLLLDVRNFSGGLTTQFDAHIQDGDPISRVVTFNHPGFVNSPVGFTDTAGLVTQFNGEVVPEPASLTLLGLGTAGLIGYGWRRRTRQGEVNPAP